MSKDTSNVVRIVVGGVGGESMVRVEMGSEMQFGDGDWDNNFQIDSFAPVALC